MIFQRRQLYQSPPGWNDSLKEGLTNLWEFDGNGLNSITGATLSPAGTISYVNGKLKQCVYLNEGYFINAESIILTNWSMSFWINATSGLQEGLIGGVLNKSSAANNYGVRINSNTVSICNGNYYGTYVYTSEAVIIPNNWIHVCIVAGANKIYVNGQSKPLTGAASIPTTINIGTNYYIGVDNYSLKERLLKGYLEQLATWNRALSEAEVLRLYNNGKGFIYS